MGHGSWSGSDWSGYSSSVSGKTRDQIFSDKIVSDPDARKSFDPVTIQVRESRDSADHPESTPIIIALDVTGTMGDIPDALVRDGLGTLCTEILDRKPVTDPQIMFMALGDARTDRAPLQVTQFESDIRIADQLGKLYLEGGGGGQGSESYNLPWYFAAKKTSTDALEKRGKKGYLFTIGDEEVTDHLLADHIKGVIGDKVESDISTPDLIAMARRQYEIYHVIIEEGSHARGDINNLTRHWNKLLGEGHVLSLSDYRKLPEVIVSAIEINEGRSADLVAKSWNGSTALVVANATKNMPSAKRPGGPGASGGLLRFDAA